MTWQTALGWTLFCGSIAAGMALALYDWVLR